MVFHCTTYLSIRYSNNDKHIAHFGVAHISSFDISTLLSLIVMSTIGNFIKNIFEEFSWRGYLTPKLIELNLNDWYIYIISGLIWALWHAAYYIVFLPNEYFESISRLNMLLSGCILMVCWSIMYVEIYRLTKSVWYALSCMRSRMLFLLF